MSSEKDIKDEKEDTKEELTSVIKPETTGINGEIMVITPPPIKSSKVVVVRPSSHEKK